jgi:hypothetical protein
MIHCERVVRMTLQYLSELLNRSVVIEVVEMIEGCAIQGVVGAERKTVSGRGCSGIRLGSSRLGQNQAEKQTAMSHHAGKQNGHSSGSVLCLETI